MEQSIQLYEVDHRERYAVDVHHHEFTQLLYVLEGAGSINIDGVSRPFEQNTVALIAPYTRHAVSSPSRLTLLVLSFQDESVQQTIRRELKDHPFRASELLKLNPLTGNELRLLMRKLLFEQRRGDRYSGWAARIHLQEILLMLARAKSGAQPADAGSLLAERVRSFIDSHYYEPITAAELAGKMQLSIRHLNNAFKEQYRITPMQYLTEVRISVAKKLLAETDKDILSVCFEIGYESLSTFYRTFKRYVQMSPNQYRNRHRQMNWNPES